MADEVLWKQAWNDSYDRQENFLFVPGDEVVRFAARYIRRRIGLNEFLDIYPDAAGSRVLDVCCGIGRNIRFGAEMGFEMFGCDLSQNAVATAIDWLTPQLGPGAAERIKACDIRELPWQNGFFAHAMCDSALDSMPYGIAEVGVAEIARVLKPGGYFYSSLISGDETGREPQFCEEVVVEARHENGTVQSYFNEDKIKCLLAPLFDILECQLTQVRNPAKASHRGRWHVTSRRR
jgi:SAM-dependent methyltransferase